MRTAAFCLAFLALAKECAPFAAPVAVRQQPHARVERCALRCSAEEVGPMSRKAFAATVFGTGVALAAGVGSAKALGIAGNRPLTADEKSDIDSLMKAMEKKSPAKAPSPAAPAPAPAAAPAAEAESEASAKRRAMVACKDGNVLKAARLEKKTCVAAVMAGDYQRILDIVDSSS